MYNILLGGAAGDGIETMAKLLEKILKKSGFHIFTTRDVMSRVRGGHNFVQIRFGTEQVYSHCNELDGIFAMNEETYTLHGPDLKDGGFVMADASVAITDERVMLLPLKDSAKLLENTKVAASVAVGAILSLFNVDIAEIKEVLETSLKSGLVEVNLAAIQKGYSLVEPHVERETANIDDYMLISGNNATALGAAAAGLKFYSAYPMSPSTGILEYLDKHGEELSIVVEQAEDEIAAINMAIGASYTGAPAMVGTSGGGFCLMVEAIGFAGIAEIPLVAIDVQRPGPATGLPTRTEQSDLKFVMNAAQGEFPRMVIALRNQEDAFYQTARAFTIARKYQMPVILLSDQYLADSTATVPVYDIGRLDQASRENSTAALPYKTYAYTESGISIRLKPGKSENLVRADSDEHDEYGFITESAEVRKEMMDKRMGKLKLLEDELIEPEFFGNEQCEALFVGFGSTYGAIKEAVTVLNGEGKKFGALLFGDIYPLPTRLLKRFATRTDRMINVEQNATGQLGELIREATLIACRQSILKYDGRQLSADYILEAIKNPRGGKNR